MDTQGHYKATTTPYGDIINLYCLHCDYIAWRNRHYRNALARYGAMRGEIVKHLHTVHKAQLKGNN